MLVLSARAHADAAVGGLRERPSVVRVAEEEVLRRCRLPRRTKPQLAIERRRMHDHARNHLVRRVEDGLQFAEGLHKLSAEPRSANTSVAAARTRWALSSGVASKVAGLRNSNSAVESPTRIAIPKSPEPGTRR
jgi:hypothetical protein